MPGSPEMPAPVPDVLPEPLPVLAGIPGLFQAHAEDRLGAALMAHEMEPSMVEQVQAYAVRVAMEKHMGPGVAWMGVSLDGQRVGMRDTVGVMWDFAVGEAFSSSAHEHLNQAMVHAQGKAPAVPGVSKQSAGPAMQMASGGSAGGSSGAEGGAT
ncbi:hypothetical protein [Hydrogenophaga sp. 5NK40-0174]|uniref:hypothetical protein n=1 Tax=Hydrogenophaga sp. 5NK40-0174 TaxID=3127649 RepID=UPI0033420A90